MKKFLLITVLMLTGVAGGIAFLANDLWRYAHRPSSADATPKAVTIRSGQGLDAIAHLLHQADMIEYPFKYKLIVQLRGEALKLKAGEYLLAASMTPLEILDKIVHGDVRLYKLTIPEGCNLHQIAALVAQAGLASEDAFYKAATDLTALHRQNIDAGTFEGYLFPETYYFPIQSTPAQIITKMTEQFQAVFTAELRERAQEMNLSVHQAVTLASIIEKETGTAEERAVISSVFHNRLKKRMRLESDPTVIYGLKSFDGNLTRKHLKSPAPYNTYVIKGLPPGPIANPGREAILAALYPADTRFLFFVSKKDTTHYFSADLKSHNRAVRKYQRGN